MPVSIENFLYVLLKYGPHLVNGLENTIIITILSFTIGFLLGLPLSILRVYAPKPLSLISIAYIELIRGTPMVVQLFIIYYGLPSAGIVKLTPLQAAIIGIGINSAAYQAEYFRTALKAIRSEQIEAALSLGMTRLQTIRYVVLPQAFRIVLPAWTNELIYLLKYSSIAMLVTVMELTNVATWIGSRTFMYFEIYVTIAIIYLMMATLLTRFFRTIERRIRVPGLSMVRAS